jgi:cobalt-zinc-cadmium resistance protein CzcA
MFKPMAMTLALLLAMIFCFTYVPVVSSLFLKPKEENPNSFSSRLIRKLKSWYLPVTWDCEIQKKAVWRFGIISFGRRALYHYGGEFIPTLDEGDFVIQPVLKRVLP